MANDLWIRVPADAWEQVVDLVGKVAELDGQEVIARANNAPDSLHAKLVWRKMLVKAQIASWISDRVFPEGNAVSMEPVLAALSTWEELRQAIIEHPEYSPEHQELEMQMDDAATEVVIRLSDAMRDSTP